MRTDAPLLGEPLPVELMNTIWADRDGVHDALAGLEQAREWLAAVGLPADLDERGHVGLRSLRDAVRRLAADVTGDPRPAAASAITGRDQAVAAVNQACARAPSWSELTWPAGASPARTTRSARSPAELAVATVAEQAVTLFADDPVTRLRACLAPGCVLYFVREHPRREWCSAGCGNRARVARHYRRHHARG
jgi:predicted RNA-binding Zn ribbon-like protein